jgi:hypothetical protein
MDILRILLMILRKQKGMATVIALVAIVGAFGVGLYFEHFRHDIDNPIEQAAEDVLDDYGIDIDFSKDKKEKDKDESRGHRTN